MSQEKDEQLEPSEDDIYDKQCNEIEFGLFEDALESAYLHALIQNNFSHDYKTYQKPKSQNSMQDQNSSNSTETPQQLDLSHIDFSNLNIPHANVQTHEQILNTEEQFCRQLAKECAEALLHQNLMLVGPHLLSALITSVMITAT